NYVKLFEVAHSLVVVELVYHLRTESSSFAYRSWTNNHCRPKLSRQKQSKLRQVRVLRMVKEQPSPDFDEAQESRIAQYSLGVWPFDSKLLDRSIHVYTHYADKLLHPYVHWGDKSLEEA
ncbi:hypothetical protein HID58_094751, partial [Brassica napus]